MRVMRTAVHESERLRRYRLEIVRLTEDLRSILALSQEIVEEEPDGELLRLATSRYLGPSDVGFITVGRGDHVGTLLVVPKRHWHDPGVKNRIMLFRRAARMSGLRCLIVPQSAIRRQPRLHAAQMVAKSAHAKISTSDRMSIIAQLALEPGTTLQDCVSLISRNDDGFAAVLSMVRAGEVEFDTSKGLSPFTSLYLKA